MKDLATVTQISREYGVPTRMHRYYERLGLLSSGKREGYAYRVYSEENVARLRQILILRKLRVPLKEIKQILDDPGTASAIAVLQKNLDSLDEEARALAQVRQLLSEFLAALKARISLPAGDALLADSRLLELANSLDISSPQLSKERSVTMQELDNMEKAAQKMTDVRIVHLPAAAVASARFVGDDPENRAGEMMADFVRKNRLGEKHPGLRLYGFNSPNPVDETGYHGYEFWVTIPEDMEVPAPLTKKNFPGGTYAAHMIQMGNFHEWAWLDQWVRENEEYEYCGSGTYEDMYGSLEEHLNYHDRIRETPAGEPEIPQLDLLIPVKRKKA